MPDKITIGAIVFDVKRDYETRARLEAISDGPFDGVSHMPTGTIFVGDDLVDDYARVILLHEVMHMVIGASGDRFKTAVEEDFISTLAAGLLRTLRDNGGLTACLVG
jgi:hypothetical protein